jgi:hypothetical protein
MKNEIIISMILASIFIRCDQRANFIPVLPEKKSDTTVVFFPDTVLVGSTVGIKYTIRDSLVSVYMFEQAEDFHARSDSFDNGLTYFTVPFGPRSGQFLINQRVITPVLTINENYNHWGANVVWYNLDTPIPLKDTSIYEDPPYLTPRFWSTAITGDTVHFSIDYFADYGIYYRKMELKFLNQGAGKLPQLITYIRDDRDDVGTHFIDTVNIGMIKIQNWDTSGFIFGKAFFSVRELSDYFTFYYNFKK